MRCALSCAPCTAVQTSTNDNQCLRPIFYQTNMGLVQPISADDVAENAACAPRKAVHDAQVATIDAIVADQKPLRDWPDAITERYEEHNQERLYREYRFLLLLGLAVAFVSSIVDYLVNPAMVEQGLILRLVAILPPTALGFAAGAMRWSNGIRFSLAAGPAMFGVALACLSLQLPPEKAAQYLLATALVLGPAILTLPLSILALARFGIAAVMLVSLTISVGGADLFWSQLDKLLTIAIFTAGTLAIAFRIERLHRTNFLLGLRADLVSDQLRDANAALRKLSETDPLTGIANRRAFENSFELQFAGQAESSSMIGLMMIDLDHFKPFNDQHGHQAGDTCLKMVAAVLQEVVDRSGGICARYGGEEFIVTLLAKDSAAIEDVAEQMRESIATILPPPDCRDLALITASIGVAIAPASAQLPREELIEMADAALYSGKKNGRNRVEIVEAATHLTDDIESRQLRYG